MLYHDRLETIEINILLSRFEVFIQLTRKSNYKLGKIIQIIIAMQFSVSLVTMIRNIHCVQKRQAVVK